MTQLYNATIVVFLWTGCSHMLFRLLGVSPKQQIERFVFNPKRSSKEWFCLEVSIIRHSRKEVATWVKSISRPRASKFYYTKVLRVNRGRSLDGIYSSQICWTSIVTIICTFLIPDAFRTDMTLILRFAWYVHYSAISAIHTTNL